MKKIESFNETTGTIARAAGVLPDLVRKYANLGLLEFRQLPDRTRVFRASAADTVRELKVKRMQAPRRRAKEAAA